MDKNKFRDIFLETFDRIPSIARRMVTARMNGSKISNRVYFSDMLYDALTSELVNNPPTTPQANPNNKQTQFKSPATAQTQSSQPSVNSTVATLAAQVCQCRTCRKAQNTP